MCTCLLQLIDKSTSHVRIVRPLLLSIFTPYEARVSTTISRVTYTWTLPPLFFFSFWCYITFLFDNLSNPNILKKTRLAPKYTSAECILEGCLFHPNLIDDNQQNLNPGSYWSQSSLKTIRPYYFLHHNNLYNNLC